MADIQSARLIWSGSRLVTRRIGMSRFLAYTVSLLPFSSSILFVIFFLDDRGGIGVAVVWQGSRTSAEALPWT